VRAHHGASAFAVQIQIANVKGFFGLLNLAFVFGIDRTRQSKFCIVRNLESFVKVFGFDDRQHRPKDLFLRDAGLRADIGDNCRLHEVAVARGAPAAEHHATFLPPDFDVIQNSVHRCFADDRPI